MSCRIPLVSRIVNEENYRKIKGHRTNCICVHCVHNKEIQKIQRNKRVPLRELPLPKLKASLPVERVMAPQSTAHKVPTHKVPIQIYEEVSEEIPEHILLERYMESIKHLSVCTAASYGLYNLEKHVNRNL